MFTGRNIRHKAEVSKVDRSHPYHITHATDMNREQEMTLKDIKSILRSTSYCNRHMLEDNWVMLERGETKGERMYTVYKDTKTENGKIFAVHFYFDEEAINYFNYHRYKPEHIGYIFQLFLREKYK